MVRWPQPTLVDVADFSGLSAHAQDLGGPFNLLKMEGSGATSEGILRTRLVATRRPQPSLDDNPSNLEGMSQRCNALGNKRPPRKRDSVVDDDSSDDEFGPDKRRTLSDEFLQRRRLNDTLRSVGHNVLCTARHQVSERSCQKLLKNHDAHLAPVTKLSEVLVITDEAKHVDKHVTTSGGKLRINKSKADNQFALSGASFCPTSKRSRTDIFLRSVAIILKPVGFKNSHRARRSGNATVYTPRGFRVLRRVRDARDSRHPRVMTNRP